MSISVEQYKKLTGAKSKKNKMNAKGVWCCGECFNRVNDKEIAFCHPEVKTIYFDSTGEFKRWFDLRLQERVGAISKLERQIPFPLIVNGIKVAKYTADFRYMLNGEMVVEDFKGFDTYASKLLRKLTHAIHGIEVKIVWNK